MTHSLRPSSARPKLTVLLLADNPSFEPSVKRPRGLESPVARHEAIISIARATFAVGGTVVVPLDIDVAPLLGTLAVDYLAPQAAEHRGEPIPPPRVTVMETQLGYPPARQLFAPLVARGAVRIVDVEGHDVLPEPFRDARIEGLSHVPRHPVTSQMLELVRPTFAVLIRPGSQVIEEVSALRARKLPTYNFGWEDVDDSTAARFRDLGVVDPTARLLEGTTRSPWAEEDDPHTDSYPVPPYAYLMQRLVAERADL